MQVILMQDLRHTGSRGEVVNVKPGFARNYLFPNGFALEATPGNLKVFDQQKRKIEIKHEEERSSATEIAAQIEAVEIKIAKRVGESETLYGSVTAAEIVEALESAGVSVDRRQVDLEGGIKTLGEHQVRIELHSDVVAEIAVTVIPEE